LDFGNTWTTLALGGGTFEPFSSPPPNTINQGFWDVCLDVNPIEENEFYLGGKDNLYRYKPSDGFKPVAYIGGSASLGTEIHADLHFIAYDKNNSNKLFVGNDGGVYRCLNASATNPIFAEKNDGLNCLQALYIDANAANKIISGSQDNGTNIMGYEPNNIQASRIVYGGDGGICVASSIFTDVYLGCTSYLADLAKSINPYPTYASFHKSNGDGNYVFDINVDNNNDGRVDDQLNPGAIWSMPMDYVEKKSNGIGDTFTVMCIGSFSNLYFSQNVSLPGVSNPTWFSLRPNGAAGNFFNSIKFTAVHINYNGTCIYAAAANNKVYRISGLDLFNTKYTYNIGNTGSWNNNGIVVEDIGVVGNGTTITSLATDPVDGEDLIITSSGYGSNIINYVIKCSQAKTGIPPISSTSIVNNLPKMPINTCAYIPGNGKNRIILGTESGLWGSDNGGNTWEELNNLDPNYNNWHPRVPVCKIQVKNLLGYNGPVIFSGTHGRGIFASTSLATAWPSSVNNIPKKEAKIFSYPNPTNGIAAVKFEATKSSTAIVCIYNYSGLLVKSYKTTIVTGNNNLIVDLNNMSSGAYLISLNTEDVLYTANLIKH
jgi:hypothetical protein